MNQLDIPRNQQQPLDRLLYRPPEAAAIMGVSRSTIYRRLVDGSLPSLTIGRCRLIPGDELAAFAVRSLKQDKTWAQGRSSPPGARLGHTAQVPEQGAGPVYTEGR